MFGTGTPPVVGGGGGAAAASTQPPVSDGLTDEAKWQAQMFTLGGIPEVEPPAAYRN